MQGERESAEAMEEGPAKDNDNECAQRAQEIARILKKPLSFTTLRTVSFYVLPLCIFLIFLAGVERSWRISKPTTIGGEELTCEPPATTAKCLAVQDTPQQRNEAIRVHSRLWWLALQDGALKRNEMRALNEFQDLHAHCNDSAYMEAVTDRINMKFKEEQGNSTARLGLLPDFTGRWCLHDAAVAFVARWMIWDFSIERKHLACAKIHRPAGVIASTMESLLKLSPGAGQRIEALGVALIRLVFESSYHFLSDLDLYWNDLSLIWRNAKAQISSTTWDVSGIYLTVAVLMPKSAIQSFLLLQVYVRMTELILLAVHKRRGVLSKRSFWKCIRLTLLFVLHSRYVTWCAVLAPRLPFLTVKLQDMVYR